MDVTHHSTDVPRDSTDCKVMQTDESCLEAKIVPSLTVTKEVKDSADLVKLGSDHTGDNVKHGKNFNVREIHETSPFKQAVKGFVLSKITGITEKFAKKPDETKEGSQNSSIHSSESDLSLSSLRTKEITGEAITSSVSCELKSVVANDLRLIEVLGIESAVECLEETKSSLNDLDSAGLSIPLRSEFRSSSISLPSSPAHRFSKRSSSVSGSLESMKQIRENVQSFDTLLNEESKNDENETQPIQEEKNESANSPPVHTELKNVENKISGPSNDEKGKGVEVRMCNIYSRDKDDVLNSKGKMIRRIHSIYSCLKSLFTTLSMTHLFLLVSVIIHNLCISSYLIYMFDALILAYIIYSYVWNYIQKPIPNKCLNFPFVDPHLEHASIHIQKSTRSVKGSVKILKGEYDPEMVNNHPTDLVDISIENCCLTIYLAKKKNNKDVNIKSEPIMSCNLIGATISCVPTGLSKGRIWNKKYPICIAILPTSSDNGCAASADYLSPATNEDNILSKKVVYLFALTDREKESLFWILSRNTEESDNSSCNEQPCDTSSKPDFSTMSYTSLLEASNEDSLTQNSDINEDESSSIADKNCPQLEFETYMAKLFENFERMSRFSSRSRSFEDVSNLKADIPMPSDSFLSKDDSFLSSVSKEYSVDWLNIVLGRLFYDFLTQKYWSDDVKARIQKKLDKIEMPSFIESLEISDVFLGTSLPQIHAVTSPVPDHNGVWFSCDFNYCGSFQMTLKTKLKITSKQFSEAEILKGKEMKQNVATGYSESSDDEENEQKIASAKKKRFINRIEKWISHKHFQKVAQSRFVKKYVGDLSNMPLTLTVELNTLHGTLTLNIPPVPTDRIWYGFRKDPVLSLNAYPKVGTHEINLSAIVQMIEKKLIQEFKKAVVMPNMDYLVIPVMYTPVYEM